MRTSVAVAFALLCGCSEPVAPAPPPMELGRILRGDDAGFARATAPASLAFPRDHGPHEDFRSEWWYWTGNLAAEGGRRFGFQLTFFRSAQAPEPLQRASAWATRQVWMAHLAVTDVAENRMLAHERFARGALGLAGARATPFAVWVEDWSARGGGGGFLPLRLRAVEDGTGIDLVVLPGDPLVLQGEDGLSRKSAEPGNASYYYSLMRNPVQGTVLLEGERFAVRGEAWLDREWSTSALAEDQEGWDWLALQLDDGSELMLYRLRARGGAKDPCSRGTLVRPDGSVVRLGAEGFTMAPAGTWTAPDGAARYPAGFEVRVPAHGIALAARPLVADQELRLSVRYWEGAVDARGRIGERPVRGHGYLEMTGYAR